MNFIYVEFIVQLDKYKNQYIFGRNGTEYMCSFCTGICVVLEGDAS